MPSETLPARTLAQELVAAGNGKLIAARYGVGRWHFNAKPAAIGDNEMIAAGSSPTTITLFNVESGQTVSSVNLSMDIRNAVHGLEVWPFDDSPS